MANGIETKKHGMKQVSKGEKVEAVLAAAGIKKVAMEVHVNAIEFADNVRGDVKSDKRLDDLVASIKRVGLLHPVLLRKGKKEGEFICVVGHRRTVACKKAGLTKIPAQVFEGEVPDSLVLTAIQLAENSSDSRHAIPVLNEAAAVNDLVSALDKKKVPNAVEEVASAAGISPLRALGLVRLANAPDYIKELISGGKKMQGSAVLALFDTESEEWFSAEEVAEIMTYVSAGTKTAGLLDVQRAIRAWTDVKNAEADEKAGAKGKSTKDLTAEDVDKMDRQDESTKVVPLRKAETEALIEEICLEVGASMGNEGDLEIIEVSELKQRDYVMLALGAGMVTGKVPPVVTVEEIEGSNIESEGFDERWMHRANKLVHQYVLVALLRNLLSKKEKVAKETEEDLYVLAENAGANIKTSLREKINALYEAVDKLDEPEKDTYTADEVLNMDGKALLALCNKAGLKKSAAKVDTKADRKGNSEVKAKVLDILDKREQLVEEAEVKPKSKK